MTMTRNEGERLAVVEDQLNTIRNDVTELKVDMKSLLQFQAARMASDTKGNRNTDVLLKAVPIVFSTISLLITLITLVVIAQEQGGI